jgi:hypothetical protein
LSVITVPLRSDLDWSADVSWVETPWTWWIPYLGFYLLGYALRDVVLRAWALSACAGTACSLSALLVWQWGRQGGFGGLLERFVPAEAYYSPVTVVLAVAVFLTARGLVRPAGFLAPLARGRLARIGRKLGDATLGVFAVHLLVLEVAERMPFIGGEAGALQPDELLARFGFVLAGAYAFSLTCARLPYLRRLV